MTRVVVSKNGAKLEDAAQTCPVQCFHKCPDGIMVIDPDECIDCGVCEAEAPEGAIVEDSEASEEDKKFNAEKSKKCPRA
ncbi:ferredoxin family protein [Pseudomonadota bacterium]